METRKRLFISNIDFDIDTEALRVMFEEIGPCLSVVIATDRETKRSRGFAFIEMEKESDADRCVKELNDRSINGRQMKVAFDKGKVISVGKEAVKFEILPPIQRIPIFKRVIKVDPFIKDPQKKLDFKDVATLSRYVSERGKILPRGHTGLSAYNQRKLKKAIRRAQNIGLMPYTL